MPILRLTQSELSPEQFRVEAALEIDGSRQIASADLTFAVTEQEREDLRWYLEDYLQHVAEPAPTIAARIEHRINTLGRDLFEALFHANDDTRDLWAAIRGRLNDTRVEIVTDTRAAATVPWELIRDPKNDVALALRASSFVRAAHQTAQRPPHRETGTGPIRILLVICRPSGGEDVPFRSVASRLIKGLTTSGRAAFALDVLRPATFEELGKVLRNARDEGTPYHVVHFDGHGAFHESNHGNGTAELSRLLLSPLRSGSHGYLLFENPDVDENMQLVDGPALGQLLAETDVPVLVLNACRSAHAEPPATPDRNTAIPDVHAEVRAFGSLAQEVIDAGVASVVAMQYNVYVVTAAQFVADLYESLARGQKLGEAVTLGRKQLAAKPLREIAYEPRRLQDWMVPIIFEAESVALFPQRPKEMELTFIVTANAAAPSSSALPRQVEKTPDAGFFGRDETLLALDRAFDTQRIVLLHAYAGNGKTSTAAEFARWYHLTGGIDGPVLFTSFEQYKTLPQALNETIGLAFDAALQQRGIHWLTLTEEKRVALALDIMSQVPVLWIWDNVEPIAGFPAGKPSAWKATEQEELADFLRAAAQTKAKILVTSRRDERGWLGDLPARIAVPPMPMQERVQLARAIADKHRRRLTEVEDWMPLLRFTRGNPLTITVLVGQALRDGLRSRAQVEAFVARLRVGEAVFDDEAEEGREKSLGASLSYGFGTFSEAEQRQLALLHHFQGFVDVDVLLVMGDARNEWHLEELRALTRKNALALLDRAAEIGLLTPHGGGYYDIHPALPWFFKSHFEMYYGSTTISDDSPALRATLTFVDAMGDLAQHYSRTYSDGDRAIISILSAEEPNLLHARRLALEYDWWMPLLKVTVGLHTLLENTGRRSEWKDLVNEMLPHYIHPVTGDPLTGREDGWDQITTYRVRIANAARQWNDAERLQRATVDRVRERTRLALSVPPAELTEKQRFDIRSLSAALSDLGRILREQMKAESLVAEEEAYEMALRIEDQHSAATYAYNVGRAYHHIPEIRDLDLAEQWYRRSLEMNDDRDFMGRSHCDAQLGWIALDRFEEARSAERGEAELLAHLNNALRLYLSALHLLPEHDAIDLGIVHNQLGAVYAHAFDFDRALAHWRESIRYKEKSGDVYSAAHTRFNVAIALTAAEQFGDARHYAEAALRDYQSYGEWAAQDILRTQELLSRIEHNP
jgi:tetratricopeptide (TPR) repeat protein